VRVLVLARLLPGAEVVIVDASAESLEVARRELEARDVPLPQMMHAAFDPDVHNGFDIVVFPLAFVGDRALVEAARSQNGLVLSHTWLTRRATRSSIVSLFLFKRLVVEGS